MGLAKLLALEYVVLGKPAPLGLLKKDRGAMIALAVEEHDVEAVATAGGWDPARGKTWEDPLHLTLCYLHDAREFAKAARVVRKVAKRFETFPLTTTRAGFFLPKEADDQPEGPCVHYVGAAAPELDGLVSDLRWELSQAGVRHDEKFPVYVPHITLEYIEPWTQDDMVKRLTASASAVPCKFVPKLIMDDRTNREVFSMGGGMMGSWSEATTIS